MSKKDIKTLLYIIIFIFMFSIAGCLPRRGGPITQQRIETKRMLYDIKRYGGVAVQPASQKGSNRSVYRSYRR